MVVSMCDIHICGHIQSGNYDICLHTMFLLTVDVDDSAFPVKGRASRGAGGIVFEFWTYTSSLSANNCLCCGQHGLCQDSPTMCGRVRTNEIEWPTLSFVPADIYFLVFVEFIFLPRSYDVLGSHDIEDECCCYYSSGLYFLILPLFLIKKIY
jgi:hypothetical protein